MARPIKNNCSYFSHDADMRNHRKIKAVRKAHKNGYAIWCMLLEYLTSSDGNTFEDCEIELELMAGDFEFPTSEIRDVLDYCYKLELLFKIDGFCFSESLNDRLDVVYKKRNKARELSKKQLRKNGKFTTNNTDTDEFPTSETPQSKVKEIKEKESKENNYLPVLKSNLLKSGLSETEAETKASEIYEADKTEFGKFQNWLSEKATSVTKMQEPFTQAEYVTLRTKIGKDTIRDLCTKMHNYKPLLKKNKSAYLTILNWHSRNGN